MVQGILPRPHQMGGRPARDESFSSRKSCFCCIWGELGHIYRSVTFRDTHCSNKSETKAVIPLDNAPYGVENPTPGIPSAEAREASGPRQWGRESSTSYQLYHLVLWIQHKLVE